MQTQQTDKTDRGADLARACRDTRERVTTLVRGLPESTLAAEVPACPGWAVRDVVAHLCANAQDMADGTLNPPPSEEQTAAQVERLRGRSVPLMLADWAQAAAPLEASLPESALRLPLLDLISHEHDIRAALASPGARDSEAVRIGSQLLLTVLFPPVPMRVVVEDAEFRVGPEEGEELVLTTSRFDALRWRMGRRSPAQLAAMQWTGDPTPVLEHLVVFGPATADVIE